MRQHQQQHVCCCAAHSHTIDTTGGVRTHQPVPPSPSLSMIECCTHTMASGATHHLPPTPLHCWGLCIDVRLTVAGLPFRCLAASLTQKRESTRVAARLVFMVVLLLLLVLVVPPGWCLHVSQSLGPHNTTEMLTAGRLRLD